jgi:hypothetical protein
MVAAFPNLFLITGPRSPSVFSNMVLSIEQHVDWIADCLAYLHEHRLVAIEATLDAEDAWIRHVNELSGYTLFPCANSWYVGADILENRAASRHTLAESACTGKSVMLLPPTVTKALQCGASATPQTHKGCGAENSVRADTGTRSPIDRNRHKVAP